jgi:eukaryotic-like serine/threonine-protein kinase
VDRHARIKELYLACSELSSAQRLDLLAHACGEDEALRSAVEAMLDFDVRRPAFLDLGARPPPQPGEAPVPRTIGRFRVLRKIGEGGMGAVFEVEQDRPPRTVALKLLRPDLTQANALRRFELEAEILGRLQHPGIARIYDSGQVDMDLGSRPYLTMELVRGLPLTQHARKHAAGLNDCLELFVRVCDAVQHAHANGVIHRDLKPANILVDEVGQVKVLDFGIARLANDDLHSTTLLTGNGQIVGTLAYMSPEQACGVPEEIDTRSDVYSLGVLLYELLAGELPYEVSSTFLPDALQAIREREPRRLSAVRSSLRGDLETIVCKALEKERERRYASAAALAADLRHFLRHEPIEARPSSRVYTLRKFVRRNRVLVGSTLCVIAALSAGLISSLRFGLAEARQRSRTEQMAEEARSQAYQSGALNAQLLFELGNQPGALQQLQTLDPERRGWEWYALNSILRRSVGELRVPDLFDAVYLDDEHVLAVDEQGRPSLWDLVTDASRSVDAPAPSVRPIVLSLDGRRMVSFGAGVLLVSDPLGDGSLMRLPFALGEPAPGNGAALSPDGSRLALVTQDRALFLIELDHLPEVACLDGDSQPTAKLCFSPDGRLLASGAGQLLRLWDVETGSLRWSLLKTNSRIRGSTFDLAHGWLASDWEGGIRLQDLATGEPVRFWSGEKLGTLSLGGGPLELALDSIGDRLAATYRTGAVRVLDPDTGALLMEVEPHKGRNPASLRFAPNGSTLMACGSHDDTVRVWSTDAEPSTVIDNHGESVYPLVVSPDGTWLATGDWDGNVRLWDATTQEELALLKNDGRVWALAVAPDGRTIASGMRTKGLAVWDVGTRSARDRFEHIPAASLAYAPDGSRLAVGDERGRLHFLDPVSFEVLVSADVGKGRIECLAWSPDSRLLAVGSGSSSLSLRDPVSGAELASVPREGESRSGTSGLLSLAFSPDGKQLAAGWGGSQLVLWNLPGLMIARELAGHRGEVFALAFSPDGSRLASGGRDRLLRLWDPATGAALMSYRGHRSYIYSLDFTPDGRRIATGSGDGTVRLWDRTPRATAWRERQSVRRAREEGEAVQLAPLVHETEVDASGLAPTSAPGF